MKIFVEYKCDNCGHSESKYLDNISTDKPHFWPVFRCETCGRGMMQKQFSASAVHLDNSFPGAAIKKGK